MPGAGTPYGFGRQAKRSPAMGAPGGAYQSRAPEFPPPEPKRSLPQPSTAGPAPALSSFMAATQTPALAFYQQALGMAAAPPQSAAMPPSPAAFAGPPIPGPQQPQAMAPQGLGAYQQALGMQVPKMQAPPQTLPQPATGPASIGAKFLTGGQSADTEEASAKAAGLHWNGPGSAYDDSGNVYYYDSQNDQWFNSKTQEVAGKPGDYLYPTPEPEGEAPPPETEGPATGPGQVEGTDLNGYKTIHDTNGENWSLVDGTWYKYGSAEYEAAVQQNQSKSKAEETVFDTIEDLQNTSMDSIASEIEGSEAFKDFEAQIEQEGILAQEAAQAEAEAKQASAGLSGAGGTAQASSAYIATQIQSAVWQKKNEYKLGLISDSLQLKINAANQALNGALGILGQEQQAALQAKIQELEKQKLGVDQENAGYEMLGQWFAAMADQGEELSGQEQAAVLAAYSGSAEKDPDTAGAIIGKWGKGEA